MRKPKITEPEPLAAARRHRALPAFPALTGDGAAMLLAFTPGEPGGSATPLPRRRVPRPDRGPPMFRIALLVALFLGVAGLGLLLAVVVTMPPGISVLG